MPHKTKTGQKRWTSKGKSVRQIAKHNAEVRKKRATRQYKGH